MHSSRMHTARFLTVVSEGGRCVPRVGGLPRGMVCPGGCLLGVRGCHVTCDCPKDCWDTPSPRGQNSCHMLVKTLPSRNYCCCR